MKTSPEQILFLVLIVVLMVIPRILQRWRVPAPLGAFALGLVASLMAPEVVSATLLRVLSALGISAVFLFAGVDLEPADFRRGSWPLLSNLTVNALALAAVSWLAVRYLHMRWQVAALLALALLTPSTGFILNALPGLGLRDDERYWVTIKAVAGELLALAVMFVVLESHSWAALSLSTAALLLLMAALPLVLLLLGRYVIVFAPGSEFSLLLMVGVVAAYVTSALGVEYLLGAFLAGFAARLLRERLPGMASRSNLHAIEMFASFFVPFYFFASGLHVPAQALSLRTVGLGVAITAVVLPLRIGVVWLQRLFVRGESLRGSLRVATALTPTLVFTLVLANLLRARFGLDDTLYGALLLYAILSTWLPSLALAQPFVLERQPQGLEE
jgi:Kef-type K+ transport system membrane component KefB